MALSIQRLVPNFCLCIGQCNTSKNDGLPVANVYAIIFFMLFFSIIERVEHNIVGLFS